MVSAANLLLDSSDAVSANLLYSYFTAAGQRTPRYGVGKYRGKVRWSRFSSICSDVLDSCTTTLQDALAGRYNEDSRCSLREMCKGAILRWVEKGAVSANSAEENLDIASLVSKFVSVRDSFPAWRLTKQDSEAKFWMFGSSGEHALRSVHVSESMIPDIFFLGKEVPPTNIFNRMCLTSLDSLISLLRSVENSTPCQGCSYEKYEALIGSRPDGGVFRSKEGTVTAYLEDDWVPGRCIRTSACLQAISSGHQCQHCKQFDSTLRSELSRFNCRTDESRKHTAHAYLSREELLERAREQSSTIHDLKQQKKRFDEFRQRMVTVNHSSEYEDLFKKLTTGLDKLQEQASSPKCKWDDCGKVFTTTDFLLTHIDTQHIRIMDSSCQLFPAYECKWEGCTHIPFTNRKKMLSHLEQHTGKSQDILFLHLLADQAKALNTPPNQMRWHPAILRWCLQQHARSQSCYEEIRKSGILRLPSGRTLLRYRNLNHPETGWHEGTLGEMRRVYDEFIAKKKGRSDRGHIGGIYFDEVKIKEGLVWDPKTDELIGFTDFPDSEPLESPATLPSVIATHVMQFHFRSLFSTFYYPCAFFLTTNAKSDQIDKMFWAGVRELYVRGFHVLVACGDGASSNRKFFQDCSDADGEIPYKTTNPYTDQPIFFLSDPTHLIKKLRNNLSKSGTHSSSTRYLTHYGEPIVWDQIRAVFLRDSERPLRFTPLRQEHVHLTSFTKMRSRLAFDIFHERVQVEMSACEPKATIAIRQFLARVKDMINFFTSHNRLCSVNDEIFRSFCAAMTWFCDWWRERQAAHGGVKSKAAKEFLSIQVYTDMLTTFCGFQGLLTWVQAKNKDLPEKDQWYLQAFRINQDFLEQYFGLQRSAGSANSNMTAYRYGYTANALSQSRVIVHNLGSESLNMPLARP